MGAKLGPVHLPGLPEAHVSSGCAVQMGTGQESQEGALHQASVLLPINGITTAPPLLTIKKIDVDAVGNTQ